MFEVLLPNLPRYVFTQPQARSFFVDWESAADEQVGQLRSARPQWGGEARFTDLVDQLSVYPEFARRWDAHAVTEKRRGVQTTGSPGRRRDSHRS